MRCTPIYVLSATHTSPPLAGGVCGIKKEDEKSSTAAQKYSFSTKRKNMTDEENRLLIQEWLRTQPQRKINYQWEIQHHNQMHKAYEQSLRG